MMDQKNIKLIPAQTENIIDDIWECNEIFLSVAYRPSKRKDMLHKLNKLNKSIKVNEIIKMIKIIKRIKIMRGIK